MTALSIVIPAYNEEKRLPASLEKIAAYLASTTPSLDVEILVVDDGSLDGTAYAARVHASRLSLPLRVLVERPNHGKGWAVRRGVLEAKGDRVLVTDADLSTPIGEWEKLAAAGAPVAIGSRAVDESFVKERQPGYRVFLGKLFNRLVRAFAVPGIQDTQCGFKLFSKEAAHAVFSRTTIDRFAFDVEALLLARKLGYAIAEIPVLWFHKEDSRVSLLGGAQAYMDVMKIRWRVVKRLRFEKEQ